MPNEIFIRVRGDDRVRRRLEATADPTVMHELHDRIATKILAWVKANVAAGGLERRWDPLRPNTIYARRESGKGGGTQPLQNTNQMMLSLNKQASATEATVGFGSKVAVFHQWGTHGPYPIAPRFKQALAFPSLWTRNYARRSLGARGFARLFQNNQRPAFADRLPKAATQRWLSVRAGTQPGAMSRMPSFQQGARGRRDYASKTFMVVQSVQHPGLPARPLLPSPGLARQLSIEVAQGLIREQLRRG